MKKLLNELSLLEMQYFQELHDSEYHKDICHLPLASRVSHLVKHLLKPNV